MSPFEWEYWGDSYGEFNHVRAARCIEFTDELGFEEVLERIKERFPHVVHLDFTKTPNSPGDVVRREYRPWTSLIEGSGSYFLFESLVDAVEFKLIAG